MPAALRQTACTLFRVQGSTILVDMEATDMQFCATRHDMTVHDERQRCWSQRDEGRAAPLGMPAPLVSGMTSAMPVHWSPCTSRRCVLLSKYLFAFTSCAIIRWELSLLSTQGLNDAQGLNRLVQNVQGH